jgi:hypothetical protein
MNTVEHEPYEILTVGSNAVLTSEDADLHGAVPVSSEFEYAEGNSPYIITSSLCDQFS